MANIVNSASREQPLDTCPLSGGPSTLQAVAMLDSQSLQELLGLTPTSNSNPVFIAIDFENIANIEEDLSQDLDCEVGLAVLDTRGFYSMSSGRLISTHNFASGTSDYHKRARKRFLFGDSIAISQENMLKSIESLVPLNRQAVFVGHDIQHDLRALDLLGFDFLKFKITALDTQSISHDSTTLRRLLLTLECPFTELHCGGNDANFTLKALLLLVMRDCTVQSGTEKRLAIMKEIALAPLPRHIPPQTELAENSNISGTDPQKKALEKRAKRLQRCRKHQSKLWSTELQEQIWAARATKRLLAESSEVKSNFTEASISRS